MLQSSVSDFGKKYALQILSYSNFVFFFHVLSIVVPLENRK